MENGQNWQDSFNKAQRDADDAFNFNAEFENEAKSAGTGTKAEAGVESENEKERRESIEKLFDFYRKIVAANSYTEVFGAIDDKLSQKEQLSALKSNWRNLMMEFHQDKYNSSLTKDPFSKEVSDISQGVSSLIGLFYEEAAGRIKGSGYLAKESDRKIVQVRAARSLDADIAMALAAEDALKKSEQAKEDAQSTENEKENDFSTEEKVENEEKENGSEKENLILGLPEQLVGTFSNYANKVWNTYEEELTGKNGVAGYLDRFRSVEKRNQFLTTLVEVPLYEKISEKIAVLIEKYGFAVEDQDKLVEFIIEKIKIDKAK